MTVPPNGHAPEFNLAASPAGLFTRAIYPCEIGYTTSREGFSFSSSAPWRGLSSLPSRESSRLFFALGCLRIFQKGRDDSRPRTHDCERHATVLARQSPEQIEQPDGEPGAGLILLILQVQAKEECRVG